MKPFFKLSLLTLIYLLLIFSSCRNNSKKRAETVQFNKGIQEYISAYTSGVISSNDIVRIRLTQEYAQEVEPGTEIDKCIFSFEPSIKGNTFWEDNRTIYFKPNEPLPSGTSYKGVFFLKNIVDVSNSSFNKFPIEFQVIKQSFRVIMGELKPYNVGNSEIYKYCGKIVTADIMDDAKVETLLRAKMNGLDLDIVWKHNTTKNEHEFEVENIERKVDDSKFDLQWDGNQYDIEIANKKEIEIPGLNNFKLVKTQILQQPSQYLLLTFSDPLKNDQNLNGLINIKGECDLKFLIEGNSIKVFPQSRVYGTKELRVNKAVKNNLGYKLNESFVQTLSFEATKPNVRLIGKGVIVPQSENGLIFPFEAVNLNAVDVRIIKIYENNIAQFLQDNSLAGSCNLRRVGRLLIKKKIDLISDDIIDYGHWNAFSFDLSDLIEDEPGAVYQIEISFRKKYSLYPCTNDSEDIDNQEENSWDEAENNEQSYWDGCQSYYNNNYYYDWENRDDPCYPIYYSRRKVNRNILASNIGLIAKTGNNNELIVIASDLMTTQPLADVELEILNYQQCLIGTAKTNENGIATIPYDMKPFLLIAKHNNQCGYLKLNDGTSLSLSKFDVGGIKYVKGIKGFIYGERGVWRPGDTIFTTFILENKNNLLPKDHPVSFEFINPQGKIVKRFVKSSGIGHFYPFTVTTKADDPTGNWMARVEVGGATFTKQIKVETVKPNRLKINLDFGKEKIYKNDKNLQGNMEVKWLHGAIAKNLEATVYMQLTPLKTTFNSYSDYVFDNSSINFYPIEKEIFSSKLDEQGKAKITPIIEELAKSPGMLKASFYTKVFEEGGNFSVNQTSLPYVPYSNFVGVKVPKGDRRRGMLLTDEKHQIDVVSVDVDGKPISVDGLTGKLYKVNWRWWWQSGSDNIGNYIERCHIEPIVEHEFSTKDGFGSFKIEVKYPDWGRYIVIVESPSGHSASKIVYIDWPGWAGRAQDKNSGGASMLTFSADKEKYAVGEKVDVTFPSSDQGRALVSIEKGSKVLQAFWVDTHFDQTNFSFDVTEEMTPNVYVNITSLQPHGQTKNDRPIRMYGVIPILVEDPDTKLEPEIIMPDELRPESEVNIKVREKNNQPMTFTLAVVNEGLLDLTNYKTPNPWHSFYAREALSVRSWDVYDLVLGAYGGRIESAFAIGGDAEMESNEDRKAQRFKPVVKFFGPYNLDRGETKSINFTMPRYIGSVKTMVVAGNDKAYGKVDKAVPVRSPLMLYATMPRVLSPEEHVKLPITLFVLDENIKDVKVELKTNGLLKVVGDSKKKISIDDVGEVDFNFELESVDKMGIAKIELVATSGKEKATYEIEMDIRAPNPPRVETYSTVIKQGETWQQNIDIFGIEGTNSAVLEISGMPPINLKKRLHYLLHYPYGCIEQTTSSVFPQLYLESVMTLDAKTKNRIKSNVKAGIKRLVSFQLSSGGFSYWPGNTEVNEWGTNYAGHFLIEAEEQGYTLPIGMKSAWLSYQNEEANNWNLKTSRYGANDFSQAYRLFTLALAGKANLGAMNRLKEYEDISVQSQCYLSMAYMYSGNESAALSVLENINTKEYKFGYYGYSYGSRTRDKAILLEGMLVSGMIDEAMPVIKEISEKLNYNSWMSTQTTAFCLRAMCKAAEIFKEACEEISYAYSLDNSDKMNVITQALINQHEVPLDESQKSALLELKNTSKTPFYVNLSVVGTPLHEDSVKEAKNLTMNVLYKTLDDKIIDPSNLEQGKDFKMEVSVKNTNSTNYYDNLALSVMLPSGWEIINTRLTGQTTAMKDVPNYQDIKDDRVNLFFGLNSHQSKTFVVLLNASYQGEYTMPAIQCSDMYNNNVRARIPGQKARVIGN